MTRVEAHRPVRAALLAAGVAGILGACAQNPPGSGATTAAAVAATTQGQRWREDKPIQPNGLLPNGLRPLRYFYW
jgi:hypothetical protein